MIKFLILVILLLNILGYSKIDVNDSFLTSIIDYNSSSIISNTSSIINEQTLHSLTESEKRYVAHAGGALEDFTYLNNVEAVRNCYSKGVRLIELDIELTTDSVPVMLHSWDGFVNKFFGVEAWKVYSSEEFNNFKMVNGWHQLTLDSTIEYMEKEFKEMYLVTDSKQDNYLILDTLANNYPHMKDRIIPQVYNQEEYHYAKKLGFKNVIYTLYMSSDTKEEIIEFCKQNDPFAITMNTYWAYTDLPSELSKLGIYTYAHTINTEEEYKTLIDKGINGIYTDSVFNIND